jgi:sugar lactone lactonase YvrE
LFCKIYFVPISVIECFLFNQKSTLMKTKLISIIAVIAIMVAFTACEEKDFGLLEPENELSIDLKAGKPGSNIVMRVIAQGAALHGTNGIRFGPDGNLYIASVVGREIIVMNKLNGKIINRFGPAEGVEGPDDLAFGPDGSLYWTDLMVGEVGRMTPEGVVTKQFVAPGVNPITFSPDGRLFVGLCFLGDGLYELDPDLSAPPRPIIEATPGNPYPLGFLNAFDFGPDGRLYGPVFAGGVVISVGVGEAGDPASTSPWTDGTIQVVATGFTWPAATKFDPNNGLLTVLDQTGEVFQVNHLTGEKTVIATLEDGLDNLAFDSNGRLYISNADHGWIVQMLPSGQGRTISQGGMTNPQGVAVLQGPDGKDLVYVADLWRLREFNGLTGKRGNIYKGHLVPKEGSMTLPMTVSVDGSHLVISSWFGSAVQVWNPESDQVLEHYPMPVPVNAIRFMDDIVVADLVLGGVVWASDYAMILPMDGANVFLPAGLVTNGEILWVADWATGIVWQIAFDGKNPLAPIPIAFGLANPEGMALDIDGCLLVMEAGAGRISRIDPATGGVSVVVDGLSPGLQGPAGFPPTWGFDGLAVGPSGAIYFTDNANSALYRIWPR